MRQRGRAARDSLAGWGRLGVGLLLTATMISAACDSGAPNSGPEGGRPNVARQDDLRAFQRRAVEIYAAVIRRLVTKDHTFEGGPSPFDHVYVLDGARGDAGNALEPEGPADKRFNDEIKKALRTRLAVLPPVDFVARSQAARRGTGLQTRVKKNGVIISVDRIVGGARRVKVANSLWCGTLCGQWQTYRVELESGSWRVTGTVGPVAIS